MENGKHTHNNILKLFIYMDVRTPQCLCGGPRPICGSLSFPYTIWILGAELGLSGLVVAGTFHTKPFAGPNDSFLEEQGNTLIDQRMTC